MGSFPLRERSRRGSETGSEKEALERRFICHSGRHRAVVFKERLRETEPVWDFTLMAVTETELNS